MVKTYNLILTSKQSYLIQFYIYDLCSYRLDIGKDYKFTGWEDTDIFRAKIYSKEHRLNKSYVIFKDLTKQEIEFIRHEINHFTHGGFDREPLEIQMGNRIIKKIKETLDVQFQRDLKLKQLLE